jgi:hypothetical protein
VPPAAAAAAAYDQSRWLYGPSGGGHVDWIVPVAAPQAAVSPSYGVGAVPQAGFGGFAAGATQQQLQAAAGMLAHAPLPDTALSLASWQQQQQQPAAPAPSLQLWQQQQQQQQQGMQAYSTGMPPPASQAAPLPPGFVASTGPTYTAPSAYQQMQMQELMHWESQQRAAAAGRGAPVQGPDEDDDLDELLQLCGV